MGETLLVGTCEVDITPPVGTALAGNLFPRTSEGIQDPLYIKAIVLETRGIKLAYVVLDLIKLYRKEGDEAVAMASERTGIPQEHIVWAVTHTHTGPYTGPIFGVEEGGIDQEWLTNIPRKFAECVSKADAVKVPAYMSRLCGYHAGLSHNRRIRFKNDIEINTWLLDCMEDDVQSLGSAGPIDPEIGILSFEDEKGVLLAVLFHFALHTNTNFGKYLSADYPAVVASRLRERFGPQVSTLFLPGAFGDLNHMGLTYQQVGDSLAEVIIRKLEKRKSSGKTVSLGAIKREVIVPYRDLTIDQERRIKAVPWTIKAQEVFWRELEIMRREGKTETKTILQAWHIGNIGFASLPGELFVEWGLKIKKESPFPWTYPIEMGGDYLGYLVTYQAWKSGGYESLIARSAKLTPEGVGYMVDIALDMLKHLYSTAIR